MNENQIKGGMKEAAGKVQKEFGKAVDSPKHQIKGGIQELAGKTQKAAGDIEDKGRKLSKDAERRS